MNRARALSARVRRRGTTERQIANPNWVIQSRLASNGTAGRPGSVVPHLAGQLSHAKR